MELETKSNKEKITHYSLHPTDKDKVVIQFLKPQDKEKIDKLVELADKRLENLWQ